MKDEGDAQPGGEAIRVWEGLQFQMVSRRAAPRFRCDGEGRLNPGLKRRPAKAPFATEGTTCPIDPSFPRFFHSRFYGWLCPIFCSASMSRAREETAWRYGCLAP